MQAVIESAPKVLDFLGSESLAHFEGVKTLLDAAGMEYRINPRLVRGMDYYNLTVFEWTTDLLGAQGTVCGGGRYDGLIEQIGGKSAPAIGFGLGIERLLLLIQELGLPVPAGAPQFYAVVPSAAALARALPVIERLRAAGSRVLMHAGPGNLKSQLQKADASGAQYALIFPDDDHSSFKLKHLRDRDAPQSEFPLRGEGDPVLRLREELQL